MVQETFLKLYRTGAWEGIREERAFLARTAWRLAVKKLPRKPSTGLDPEMPAPARNSPEKAAITADWIALVHRLIDTLPEELRQPLALSSVEELSSREIAEVMGIAEGTVRTRILRARQILREKLAGLVRGGYGA
ncbi:MAG TPA: RNA polymerase sigma factor [Bryobacteraceae bacterium]|nr:RNA polymerase sigma factor [Bryobacteraceae bacterium]